jgi:uncharacterized protein YrzB (UPF0473 family)
MTSEKKSAPAANTEKATPVTEDEMDDIRVTINLDDGDMECKILKIFEYDGRDYIALIPLDENGKENAQGDYYLYRHIEDRDGIPSIEYIEDDEEFEAVDERFDELLDEELYDGIED